MLIKSVVQEEQRRNSEMAAHYTQLIADLPKGTLVVKRTKAREYYYLKYRFGKKVISKYIGKDAGSMIGVRHKLEQRKHCVEMLIALQKEQKAIAKILEELK
jgi:hypothetical protein